MKNGLGEIIEASLQPWATHARLGKQERGETLRDHKDGNPLGKLWYSATSPAICLPSSA